LELVNKAIKENGLGKDDLEIEITEGTLIKTIEKNPRYLLTLYIVGLKYLLMTSEKDTPL